MTELHEDHPPRMRHTVNETTDWILSELCKDEYRIPFLTGLRAGLIRGDRSDKRLYAQMLKMVGAERELALVVVQGLGANNEDEARELIEAGRRMRQLKNDVSASYEDYRNMSMDLMKLVLSHRPEWRSAVVQELGGVLPLTNGAAK